MAPTPTEPGWYPDPWGTEGERRFDGVAWGRETRPGPDARTPVAAPGPVATTTTPGPVGPAAGAGLPSVGGAPPAAWYPDPAGSGGLRYWDGAAWTVHTAYTAAPAATGVSPRTDLDPVRLLASERARGRVARALLLLAGPALAAYVAATIVVMYAIGPDWRRQMERPGTPIRIDPVDIPRYVSTVSNVAMLVLLAAGLVFVLWLGTAGKVALATGRPLRHGPWLGAWSFLIPVVQFWWPYRATRELLGPDPGAGRLVARWWILFIVAATSQFGLGAIALLGAPAPVVTAATAVIGIVAIVAAFQARSVIAAVERDHTALVGATPQP